MPVDLSNRQSIKSVDKSDVLGSVEHLPKQIEHAWEDTKNLDYADFAADVKQIVMVGMGGSGLGARVIKSLYGHQLTVPLELVNDYNLPGFINKETLVVLSSYSGTTEEVLRAGESAMDSGARIAAIYAGGTLQDWAEEHDLPRYHMNVIHNPSNQPRMAIGYSVFGQLGLFKAMGILDISQADIDQLTNLLNQNAHSLKPEATNNNLAKTLANQAKNKMTYLVSAEHLHGPTHVFNNQLNENAKHLTAHLKLPEINHHYLEALVHPKDASHNHLFWFVSSNLYSPELQKRVKLTQHICEEKGFETHEIMLNAQTPLLQAFELIQLGAFTNFYLAMLHEIDPAPIPTVNYFKKKLKES